jgi:hypothetical protein
MTACIDHSCAGLAGAWFQPAETRRSTRAGRSTTRQGPEGAGWRHCTGRTSSSKPGDLTGASHRPSRAKSTPKSTPQSRKAPVGSSLCTSFIIMKETYSRNIGSLFPKQIELIELQANRRTRGHTASPHSKSIIQHRGSGLKPTKTPCLPKVPIRAPVRACDFAASSP